MDKRNLKSAVVKHGINESIQKNKTNNNEKCFGTRNKEIKQRNNEKCFGTQNNRWREEKRECSWHVNEEITVRQRPFAALGRRFILVITLEGI